MSDRFNELEELLQRFDAEQLRLYIRRLEDGKRLCDRLPYAGTTEGLRFDATRLLISQGYEDEVIADLKKRDTDAVGDSGDRVVRFEIRDHSPSPRRYAVGCHLCLNYSVIHRDLLVFSSFVHNAVVHPICDACEKALREAK